MTRCNGNWYDLENQDLRWVLRRVSVGRTWPLTRWKKIDIMVIYTLFRLSEACNVLAIYRWCRCLLCLFFLINIAVCGTESEQRLSNLFHFFKQQWKQHLLIKQLFPVARKYKISWVMSIFFMKCKTYFLELHTFGTCTMQSSFHILLA